LALNILVLHPNILEFNNSVTTISSDDVHIIELKNLGKRRIPECVATSSTELHVGVCISTMREDMILSEGCGIVNTELARKNRGSSWQFSG